MTEKTASTDALRTTSTEVPSNVAGWVRIIAARRRARGLPCTIPAVFDLDRIKTAIWKQFQEEMEQVAAEFDKQPDVED